MKREVCSSSRLFANATKFVFELLHATGAVDESLLTGVGRVRVGGDVLNDDLILDVVDDFSLLGGNGGAGQKFLSR